MNQQPKIIFMIGVPMSGKSTFISKITNIHEYVVLSTDNIIQNIADEHGITYNQAWGPYIKGATKKFNYDFAQALKENKNIIIDQTNLSASSRRKKLSIVPQHYDKIAVVLDTPSWEELYERNEKREGKRIPYSVLKSMIDNFDYYNVGISGRHGYNAVYYGKLEDYVSLDDDTKTPDRMFTTSNRYVSAT